MSVPARQWYSFAEYAELEQTSPIKHEYLEGEVWAMAGGSPEHAAIAMNIGTLLSTQLRGKPCQVFSSDLRVRCKATGLSTYADLTVICDRLEHDPEDPRKHTVTNPKVLVEVLSASTEHYDRGEKLDHYRQIPSLNEVVLVAHDERRLDIWRREGSGWEVETIHEEGTATLRSLGCVLSLEDVYRSAF